MVFSSPPQRLESEGATALRARPADRAGHVVQVGPYDLSEAPVADAHTPRLLLPKAPERRPSAGSRSPALRVAAAVLDIAALAAHLLSDC
jgi:hypothetical protein